MKTRDLVFVYCAHCGWSTRRSQREDPTALPCPKCGEEVSLQPEPWEDARW